MNQKARQKVTSPVKRDFYKLLNNSNFGIDCRNNIDNCVLEPLYDEIGEILYIKKFCTIFGNETYRDFFSPIVMREDINQKYNSKIMSLNKNNPTYQTRKECLENKMGVDLDAVNSFEQNLEKGRKKRKFMDIDSKIEEAVDSRKTKMILEFSNQESASIKSFAVKRNDHIKVTTRFLSSKMLKFAKLSLMSFTCEVLETFCFPDENVRSIFKKYHVKKVEIYHVLTDTDSTSLKFLFIFDPGSETTESKYREIIFEVITSSKIYKRFDSSHEYWDKFGVRKEKRRKKLRYFEIEQIDNPCILTIAANPKEYFEMFEDKKKQQKTQRNKKGIPWAWL